MEQGRRYVVVMGRDVIITENVQFSRHISECFYPRLFLPILGATHHTKPQGQSRRFHISICSSQIFPGAYIRHKNKQGEIVLFGHSWYNKALVWEQAIRFANQNVCQFIC